MSNQSSGCRTGCLALVIGIAALAAVVAFFAALPDAPSNPTRTVEAVAPTATPTPTCTPRPRPTPTPQVTYAACDDVPTYLLRRDTQGRVAVGRQLVPSQPDGDGDGFACGDQLEHRQAAVAAYAAAPTATPTRTRTARVAPTPSECPTAAELRYLESLGEDIELIGTASGFLGELFAVTRSDRSWPYTDEFAIRFLVPSAALIVASERMLNREPPASPRLKEIDANARLAARAAADGILAVAESLDHFDADRMAAGAELIAKMNDHIDRITISLRQMCAT